jgi:BrnA antitoxin of type II toxin-antitoxin system
MDAPNAGLLPEFQGSAAPPPERVTVTLDLDADVVEWLKAQPLGLQAELNDLARFFMDSSAAPVEAYDDAGRWEIAGPDTDRDAHRIDTEYIPG